MAELAKNMPTKIKGNFEIEISYLPCLVRDGTLIPGVKIPRRAQITHMASVPMREDTSGFQ
jgi:hypothetical protein